MAEPGTTPTIAVGAGGEGDHAEPLLLEAQLTELTSPSIPIADEWLNGHCYIHARDSQSPAAVGAYLENEAPDVVRASAGLLGEEGFGSTDAAQYLHGLRVEGGSIVPLALATRLAKKASGTLAGEACRIVPDATAPCFTFASDHFNINEATQSSIVLYVRAEDISAKTVEFTSFGWLDISSDMLLSSLHKESRAPCGFDLLLVGLPPIPDDFLAVQVVDLIARCLSEALPQILHFDDWSRAAAGAQPLPRSRAGIDKASLEQIEAAGHRIICHPLIGPKDCLQ